MRPKFLYRLGALLIAGMIALLGGTAVAGQSTQPLAQKETRVNLNYHLGSVVVSSGFKGEVTANWTDAWAGYFQSGTPSIRIGWRAGTIQRVRDNRKAAVIVWEKTEKTSENSIQLTLLRDKDGDILVAKIGDLDFDVLVQNETHEDIFMSLVRSYQKERCRLCPSLKAKVVN